MTTPPPPPPGQPDWPSSQPAAVRPASGGRQPWWTGGRIALAVVLVLVLMGGAAFAGFLAGMAVSGFDAVTTDGLDFDFDEAFDGDVPGVTSLDTATVAGPALRRGATTEGTLGDRPVDHSLTLETGGPVMIELTSPDFDAVLVLLDDTGALVDSDDDDAGGTDSLLEVDLAAGSYTVRVQSWGSGESGSYAVAVE